ncbi:hypothetical protein ACLD5P_04395 [Gardnerella leopoldii]|uniref:hypothetical protein n=1 Tax=Gardnerella leopoldii TaxID=2792978 RepID=UPI00397045FB
MSQDFGVKNWNPSAAANTSDDDDELSEEDFDKLAAELEQFFTKYVVLENNKFVVHDDAIIADGYGEYLEGFHILAEKFTAGFEEDR